MKKFSVLSTHRCNGHRPTGAHQRKDRISEQLNPCDNSKSRLKGGREFQASSDAIVKALKDCRKRREAGITWTKKQNQGDTCLRRHTRAHTGQGFLIGLI